MVEQFIEILMDDFPIFEDSFDESTLSQATTHMLPWEEFNTQLGEMPLHFEERHQRLTKPRWT